MNKFFQLIAIALLLSSTNLYAHHPAADMVDEDIYAMIDSMVEDTPHATLTFDEEMGSSGITETTITLDSVGDLESLILRDDMLEYIELLDGEVDLSITFNEDGSVTVNIIQDDYDPSQAPQ